MVALRSLDRERAWLDEPEVLWERRYLDAEDERDRADAVRLAEQAAFRGGPVETEE